MLFNNNYDLRNSTVQLVFMLSPLSSENKIKNGGNTEVTTDFYSQQFFEALMCCLEKIHSCSKILMT